MKKLCLIIAIVFGLAFGAFAQGGLFKYGMVSDEEYYGSFRGANNPLLPANHSYDTTEKEAKQRAKQVMLVKRVIDTYYPEAIVSPK